MRYLLAALLILAACGGSSPDPTAGRNHTPFQPPDDVPRIHLLVPIDSLLTEQPPSSLDPGQHLAPGPWPFSWVPIDGAERYVVTMMDVTGVQSGARAAPYLYASETVDGPTAWIELDGAPLDGLLPRVYYFEVAALDGFEVIAQSDGWAIGVGP